MQRSDYLKEVPPEKAFWVHDGKIIKSLEELPAALEAMSDETFNYHVNKEKNDFANWVRDVIGDRMLALTLQMVKSRRGAIDAVRRRIKQLK